jgi:hypothetical protein
LPADHPFRTLDNLLATPHIGYVTEELIAPSTATLRPASPRGSRPTPRELAGNLSWILPVAVDAIQSRDHSFSIPVWNKSYPGMRATWIAGTNDVGGG